MRALSRIRKAAEQGPAEAQNNLGLMYDKGQGVCRRSSGYEMVDDELLARADHQQ